MRDRIQGAFLWGSRMNFLPLPNPSIIALLELAQEEGIPEWFGKDIHLVVFLPSAFLLLLASEVLTINL